MFQNNKCIFLIWRKRLKLSIDEVYFLLIKTLLFTDGWRPWDNEFWWKILIWENQIFQLEVDD